MRYVENELLKKNKLLKKNELLKKRGKTIEVNDKDDKDEVDELYVMSDHLKVCLWLNSPVIQSSG